MFGRTFDLITDHKPLEVIFGPRSRPCARIERWVLRLQSYKYNVIYKPGKTNIADPLSRLVVHPDTRTTFDEEAEHYVNWVANAAAPVAIKLLEIQQHSEIVDEIRQSKLLYMKTNGWKKRRRTKHSRWNCVSRVRFFCAEIASSCQLTYEIELSHWRTKAIRA